MSFWYRLVSDYDLTILTSPVANYLSIHLDFICVCNIVNNKRNYRLTGTFGLWKGVCVFVGGGGGGAVWGAERTFFLENLNFENVIEQPILNYIH